LTFTAAAWRSPDAKAQIDYEIDSQQEAWHLPGDGHGLRRPAAAPCEPEDVVWADSVASLFTLAARRAATSPSVKKHAVIARTALCTPVAVLYSTLGRAINSEQANAAAASGRNCFFQNPRIRSQHQISRTQPAGPPPQLPLHISLATNIEGSLGTAARTQSQSLISEPGRWVGTLLRFGPARPRAKRRTSFEAERAVRQCSTAVEAEAAA
jgi:hypothetical protein